MEKKNTHNSVSWKTVKGTWKNDKKIFAQKDKMFGKGGTMKLLEKRQKIVEQRKGQTTPVFLPGKSHG